MEVFLAGRVAIEADGVMFEEERFPGRLGRLLFAYLAVEHGRAVPRDELAEALWGDGPPPTWEKALTVHVSKLRALLTDAGIDGGKSLTSASGCYRLDLPEGSSVDILAAGAAVRHAEKAFAEGNFDAAKAAAAPAESLLSKPFLPGEDGSWVDDRRHELTDLHGRSVSVLAGACLRADDLVEAIHWAEQSIALTPFRETGYRRLMEAHIATGNRAEALRVYERCRHLLAEELGTYPSPETDAIFRDLLEAPPHRARIPERPSQPVPHFGRKRRVYVGAGALVLAVAAGVGVAVKQGGAPGATEAAPNTIAFVGAHDGRLGDVISLGQAPTAVAVGDSAVWAANATANTVSRINPLLSVVTQTIAVGSSPSGIAVGGGGVWVASHDDATVAWINPQSNTVVREITVGSGPNAIAYGAGSVWVANGDDRTVFRIDPSRGRVVKRIETGAVGRGITVGGGFVWVTDESSRKLVQIDPRTNRVVGRPNVGTGPTGVAYGDGSVWVANTLDETVSQIDATTLAVRSVIPLSGSPSAIAYGNGSVWVSTEFSGRIVRINPRSGTIVGSTTIGNRPEGTQQAATAASGWPSSHRGKGITAGVSSWSARRAWARSILKSRT